MRVIAKKEFDSNSNKFFDFVQQKEPIMVERTDGQLFLITKVEYDEEPLSADEQAKIQRGLDDIKAGRVTRIKDVNNIWESIL